MQQLVTLYKYSKMSLIRRSEFEHYLISFSVVLNGRLCWNGKLWSLFTVGRDSRDVRLLSLGEQLVDVINGRAGLKLD